MQESIVLFTFLALLLRLFRDLNYQGVFLCYFSAKFVKFQFVNRFAACLICLISIFIFSISFHQDLWVQIRLDDLSHFFKYPMTMK